MKYQRAKGSDGTMHDVPVSDEVYRYSRSVNDKHRRKMISEDRCSLTNPSPKQRIQCTGVCDGCKYRIVNSKRVSFFADLSYEEYIDDFTDATDTRIVVRQIVATFSRDEQNICRLLVLGFNKHEIQEKLSITRHRYETCTEHIKSTFVKADLK